MHALAFRVPDATKSHDSVFRVMFSKSAHPSSRPDRLAAYLSAEAQVCVIARTVRFVEFHVVLET